MRILLNASNLRGGGGVAVASSIIDAITRMDDLADEIVVLASSEVAANLTALGSDIGALSQFHIFSVRGLGAMLAKAPVRRRDVDVVFNVFGPVYSLDLARGSVMGFAVPWIAFPSNPLMHRLTVWNRMKVRLVMSVKARAFRLAGRLVVEQDAVKDALKAQRRFRRKRVDVVPNTADTIFNDPRRWQPIHLPNATGDLRLGAASRNYPHKNFDVVPEVLRILRTDHGISADFFCTFDDLDWGFASPAFRRVAHNVGPLRLSQTPSFYRQLDGVLFPTQLECFSATPLEAKELGVPLFASGIPTVRETVGSYGHYFDPDDPADIAATIAGHFRPTDGVPGAAADGSHSGAGTTGTAADPAVHDPASGDARTRAQRLLHLCRLQAQGRGSTTPFPDVIPRRN